MLYIESIDNYSVRFGNGTNGGTAFKVYPKTLRARLDEEGRVWIYDTETDLKVVNSGDYTKITLGSTVYATAHNLVASFNAVMNNTTYSTTTTTAAPTTTTTTTTP